MRRIVDTLSGRALRSVATHVAELARFEREDERTTSNEQDAAR